MTLSAPLTERGSKDRLLIYLSAALAKHFFSPGVSNTLRGDLFRSFCGLAIGKLQTRGTVASSQIHLPKHRETKNGSEREYSVIRADLPFEFFEGKERAGWVSPVLSGANCLLTSGCRGRHGRRGPHRARRRSRPVRHHRRRALLRNYRARRRCARSEVALR